MKLLQVGSSWFSYQFSGLERYYAALVTRLPALGTEVIGLVYELTEAPKVEGLKLVSFGTQQKSLPRKFLDQRRLMKRYLRNGIDLVVSHCTPSLFPSLGDLGHKPLVCHFHGPRYLERTVEGANALSVRLSKYVESKVYARTDHGITLSQYMKRVLVEEYGFPEGKVSVIPGGVDIDRFKQPISRAEARQCLGLPQGRPLMLSVRRLERRMGLHHLIEAMADVVRDHPEALLLIAGKGTLKDELEQHIHSSNLVANVRMLGAVSDHLLPTLYKAVDFSIVPTTAYEGFGLILIESLASGTPALGTPLGAIPEVLNPLSASLLLESPAPEHLATGMREVLAGQRVLPSMEVCEAYAAETFAWPIIVSKVQAVYRAVVGAHRPVRA